MATHSLGSLNLGVQQRLQPLAVQAVSLPEVVDVQLILHPSSAICDAEEVPLRVASGAAVRGQPQLVLLS